MSIDPRSRALVVGINKFLLNNGDNDLQGCVNDAQDIVKQMLAEGWDKTQIEVLLDEDATTQNELEELERGATEIPADCVFYFADSSHGALFPTPIGNVPCICPHDFAWDADHMITDKQLVAILSKANPLARLYVTLDACHSGSMDRDLAPSANPRYSKPRFIAPPPDLAMHPVTLKRDVSGLLNIGFIGGCHQTETCADANINGEACGAFTHYMLLERVLNPARNINAHTAIITDDLSTNDYDQTPQCDGPLVGQPLRS